MANSFSVTAPNITTNSSNNDIDHIDSGVFMALCAAWGVLGLLSLAMNSTVCLLMYCDKKLHTVTNYFVLSLSVADLLVSVVLVPLFIVDNLMETAVSGYLVGFLLVASIFNMSAVTYERYIALTRPFAYRAIMNSRKTFYIIVGAWIIPLAISLVPLAWDGHQLTLYHDIYLAILVFGITLIPCVAMIVIYLRLFTVVRSFIRRNRRRTTKGNRTGDRAGSEEKATRVFALILAMFLLCWLPIILMNICVICKRVDLITMPMQYASFFTLVLNTVIDPLIYAFLKKDFNQALKRKLKFRCLGRRGRHESEAECVTLQTVEGAESV